MSFQDETFVVKAGLAKMLKGGVIMDVINVEQAIIAEKAGAVAGRILLATILSPDPPHYPTLSVSFILHLSHGPRAHSSGYSI
jgi:hypothetical protein